MNLDNKKYTALKGVYVKGTGNTGEGSGAIRLPNLTDAPISTATEYGLYVKNGSLVFYNAGSETTVGSSGGGVASLDSLYDLDKALTLDDASLTFAGTHATNDVITITNATGTGDCLQITNSGTGKDIQGTAGWDITKAGVVSATGLTMGDDKPITLGATSDATIQWVNASSFTDFHGAVNFDGAITGESTVTAVLAGVATGTAVVTLTAGDLVLSDGVASITQSGDASALTIVADSQVATNVVDINADGLTTGSILHLDTTAAGFTGKFVDCYNGAATVMSVGLDGATTIATTANSTVGLKVTGIQTAEDLVELTSSGVTATGQGVLLINSSGASADGSAQIRIAPSGSPVEGSAGIKFVGASKVMQALNLDGDSVDNSVAKINGGGALAANKAVLEVLADGTPAANTASAVRVDVTGITATNNPYAVRVLANGKDAGGLYIDSDSATLSAVAINCGGAIATGKAAFALTADGTPAAADSYLALFDYTAMTSTNNPVAVKIASKGTAQALEVTSTGAGADNKGVLSITTSGATAAGGSVLRVTGTGTPAAATSYLVDFDYSGATMTNNPIGVYVNNGGSTAEALSVVSTAATNTGAVTITNNALTTGTGLLVTSSGTVVTTGEMISVVANSATTSTGLVRVSGTALTDGFAMELTGGGANATASGGVLNLAAGAATDGSALKITTSGVYAGTVGVVDINAASATTGTIVDIGAAGLTEGTGLKINAVEATLTTGKYLDCYDGAASDFSVEKYGATVIAGNASGTAALTLTAGDATLTSGNVNLTNGYIKAGAQAISNANTAIDVTHTLTTIANNAASTHALADGVAGQIKIITCITYTGDAVISPANFHNGTTITLNAVGDSATLIFAGTKWAVIGTGGTTAIA